MTALRSLLFNLFFFIWSPLLLLVCLPLLLAPPAASSWVGRIWVRVSFWGLAKICGLTYRIVGRENLPPAPFMVAAKHQSAWDTMVCALLFERPCFVLKRELMWIPLFGWFLWRADMVPIDRKGGAKALKSMVARAKPLSARGRELIVFPEGTRTAPGASAPYHPGIAALYGQLGIPLVPVALNSGVFWGRHSFQKRPGVITLEILPPIAPGLPRKELMPKLQSAIETASNRLANEAE